MTDEEFASQLALPERYHVEREIGRGGTAIVLLARDQQLSRRVAIKVLLPEIASAVSVDRFLREVRIAVRLVHPHIVQLFDSGLAGELPYYVMPFFAEDTLRTRILAQPQLELGVALRIVGEVADALNYAHAAGVVHRDIKPENILFNAEYAMVADFGIAKAIDVAAEPIPGTTGFTTAAYLIGTAAYMSPEQAAGDEKIDGRSDIYSLAVVLWELLAGYPLFNGPTPAAIMAQHFIGDAPSVRTVRSDVPPEVDAAIARALERSPAERFATANEFAQALAGMLSIGSRPALVPPDTSPSIAVLPFKNNTGSADNEYFSDGMTDAVIDALARLRQLHVVARTSVFALKDKAEDVRAIGRRLNVRTIVEGSVRGSGNHVRISANLVNVADGFQIWSAHFDGELSEVFALQDEIAQTIVRTLRPSLPGVEAPAREKTSPETYRTYLMGRHFLDQRKPVEVAKAAECFREVVAHDPEFALGHAGEADVAAIQYLYGFATPLEVLPRAQAAAERAIKLDPFAAEPHAALGTVRAVLEWNWHEAAAEFRRSVALSPTYTNAYTWYANLVLTPLGRFDEAIEELKRALVHDPLAPVITSGIGMAHYYARRYDEADAACRRVVELAPKYLIAYYFLGKSLVERGRFDDALAVYRELFPLSGGNPYVTTEIGYAHARAGARASAESSLNMLRAVSSQQFVSSCWPALIHAALGNVDEAVQGYEAGFEQHATDLLFMAVHPGLDNLRRDPRFMALINRVGLIGHTRGEITGL